MPLDLTGQPLIDRSDFQQLLAADFFGQWSEQAISLHDKGYCVVNLSKREWLANIDGVIEDLQPLLESDLKLWECGESGPPRLQDGWIDHGSIRALALEPVVLDLLRHLYGREPSTLPWAASSTFTVMPFIFTAIPMDSCAAFGLRSKTCNRRAAP
jgi:hypothetical protein